jgi:hypothetical protein
MFAIDIFRNNAEKRFDMVTAASNASSDFAAVWADFDL